MYTLLPTAVAHPSNRQWSSLRQIEIDIEINQPRPFTLFVSRRLVRSISIHQLLIRSPRRLQILHPIHLSSTHPYTISYLYLHPC